MAMTAGIMSRITELTSFRGNKRSVLKQTVAPPRRSFWRQQRGPSDRSAAPGLLPRRQVRSDEEILEYPP
jgi:hypothetical protein